MRSAARHVDPSLLDRCRRKHHGANCIIPTNQNLANLEADMASSGTRNPHKPVDAMQLDLEMLVRAYDPCISCSVHVLRLEDR